MTTLAFALAVFLAQQDPPPLPPKEDPPAVAKDETEVLIKDLKEAWTKVFDFCREDKKDEVQKAVAAMELTREDMVAHFGEEKAARVHSAYQHTWQKVVLVEAAADLIARFKRDNWNEVEVWCINTTEDKQLSNDDRGVLASLANREELRVFNVRLKQKERMGGLVLRCFVKTKAGWRMGLRIGKTLQEK